MTWCWIAGGSCWSCWSCDRLEVGPRQETFLESWKSKHLKICWWILNERATFDKIAERNLTIWSDRVRELDEIEKLVISLAVPGSNEWQPLERFGKPQSLANGACSKRAGIASWPQQRRKASGDVGRWWMIRCFFLAPKLCTVDLLFFSRIMGVLICCSGAWSNKADSRSVN